MAERNPFHGALQILEQLAFALIDILKIFGDTGIYYLYDRCRSCHQTVHRTWNCHQTVTSPNNKKACYPIESRLSIFHKA